MTTNPRLATIVHYVIARSDPEKLGATKLNKVLWYADIVFYRRHGKTLTGEDTYIKRQFGPVPSAITPTLETLRRDGKILERTVETPAGNRRQFLWLEQPDLATLNSEEIDVIHEVMDWICNNESAKSISDKTHDALWQETEIGAPMSVRAASIVSAEISPEAIEWAKKAFA